MRAWKIIVLLALLIVALALISLPARVVVPRLLPAGAGVQVENLAGSIWSGRAGRVAFQGRELGRLDWRLAPLALLRGRLRVDLALDGGEVSGRARVERAGQRVRVEDAKLEFPAQWLEPVLDIPALRLLGRVDLQLEQLELRDRVPTGLQGQALWRQAGVGGAARADLGTLRAEFGALSGGGFGGRVHDQGGPLALDGSFRTRLLGWEAQATMVARDGDPQVTRALAYIGQPREDGSVLFEVQGGFRGIGR